MIVHFEPPTASHETYWSPWNRGKAVLLINMGHGEYPLRDDLDPGKYGSYVEGVTIETFDAYDLEEGKEAPDWWTHYTNIEVDAREWGLVTRIEAPVFALWLMFYDLANQLDPVQDPSGYTPGSDDDTFDYYPSAFEALCELGEDLDELDYQFEINPNLPSDLRRKVDHKSTVRRILANLTVCKGPFEDWEFESYAAPYFDG